MPIPQTISPLKQFIGKIRPLVVTYKCIEMKIGAKKLDTNNYILFSMDMHLSSSDQGLGREVLFNSDDLLLLTLKRPITLPILEKILQDLEKGNLQIDGQNFKIEEVGAILQGWGRIENGGHHYFNTLKGNLEGDFPYLVIGFKATKPLSDFIDMQKINKGLKEYGYPNFSSLYEEKLGKSLKEQTPPIITLTAPIYLHFNPIHVEEEWARIWVECHENLNIEDVKISYEIKGEEPQRGNYQFTKEDYILIMSEFGDDFRTFEKTLEPPETSESIRIWLFFQGENVGESFYRMKFEQDVTPEDLSNLKWRVIEKLSSKTNLILKKWFETNLGLKSGIKDGSRFEIAILNLMSIAGFEVLFLGTGFDAQGIDILAFISESRIALPISCTSSNDIREKLRTLLPQLTILKKELDSYTFLPAIFMPMNEEEVINMDLEMAARQKVAVFLSSDIREIYNMLNKYPTNELKKQVLEYFEEKIPDWRDYKRFEY